MAENRRKTCSFQFFQPLLDFSSHFSPELESGSCLVGWPIVLCMPLNIFQASCPDLRVVKKSAEAKFEQNLQFSTFPATSRLFQPLLARVRIWELFSGMAHCALHATKYFSSITPRLERGEKICGSKICDLFCGMHNFQPLLDFSSHFSPKLESGNCFMG